MPNQTHPYLNQTSVLTSKHHKLSLVGSIFEKVVGLHILESALDTDQLGTFTGEIERDFPPLETAIRKAKMGMLEQGLPIGLASEGSIGPDPLVPFVNSDVEILVLVDDERDLVISEVFRSFEITAVRITSYPEQDLSEFLKKADFPRHKLIVKPNAENVSRSIKGISTLQELKEAIDVCSKSSPLGNVLIESDLRAHNSPSRQRNISQVAALLAARTSQLCPQCHMPGWGRVRYEKGLLCSTCKSFIPEAAHREINGCVKCEFESNGKVLAESADPSICLWCNP